MVWEYSVRKGNALIVLGTNIGRLEALRKY